LAKANDKFTRRFDALEAALEEQGRSVHSANPSELESAWQVVKTTTARRPPATSVPPTSARGSRRRRSQR
jgi:hypothetical protein